MSGIACGRTPLVALRQLLIEVSEVPRMPNSVQGPKQTQAVRSLANQVQTEGMALSPGALFVIGEMGWNVECPLGGSIGSAGRPRGMNGARLAPSPWIRFNLHGANDNQP
jgi:hypothetical protein